MKRIRLGIKAEDGTVATFDLAIVREDGTKYEAGPDDSYELFLVENALMRLYIRDGKKLDPEDIALVMQWVYCRYVPELLPLEEFLAAEYDALIH